MIKSKNFDINVDLPIWLDNKALFYNKRIIHPGSDMDDKSCDYSISKSKIKEFTNIINAGDGTVTAEILDMAKGFKSMYSNKHQDSTESMMTSFANMLKNGVEYEEALTAIGEVYQMPKNTSYISANFIDLLHQK